MARTQRTKVTVIYDEKSKRVLGALEDVSRNGAFSQFGQYLKKTLDETGAQAEAYLQQMISKELYKQATMSERVVNGVVVEGRTGLFRKAARYMGARITGRNEIEAGLFDMGLLNLRERHSSTTRPYWDILEEGHEPFTIKNPRQKKAWFFILKTLGLWDQNIADLDKKLGGINSPGISGGTWRVPAMKPYRFFQRTQDRWDDLIHGRKDEFMNYINQGGVGVPVTESTATGWVYADGSTQWTHGSGYATKLIGILIGNK